MALELEKEKRLRGIVFLGGFASHSEDQLKKIPVPFVLSTVSLLGEEYKNDYSFVSVNDVEESFRMTDVYKRQLLFSVIRKILLPDVPRKNSVTFIQNISN